MVLYNCFVGKDLEDLETFLYESEEKKALVISYTIDSLEPAVKKVVVDGREAAELYIK